MGFGLTAASISGSAISTRQRWDCFEKDTDESEAICNSLQVTTIRRVAGGRFRSDAVTPCE